MSETDQISKTEAEGIIASLRKELGDKMSTMTGVVIAGTTADEMRKTLEETIALLWVESGFNLVLKSKPELTFKYWNHHPVRIEAHPKNESAKRVVQMLNLMHPTHRIKKKGD